MPKSYGTTGIDIQREYLCVAQYSRHEESVRQIALQPLPVGASWGEFWEAVSRELTLIRRSIKFYGADVVCSLPSDLTAVKTLEAESDVKDDQDHQEAILRFELGVNLGGELEEYAYDFYEGYPGAERRRYVATALRKETLARLKRAFKGAKLNPYIVDVDFFALTTVFKANYRDQAGAPTALVLGERRRTKVILVNNELFLDSAVVEYDLDRRGPAGYGAALQAGVAGLAAANAEFLQGAAVQVYLAGGLFADSGLLAAVQAAVAGSEALDPFKKLTCAAGLSAAELSSYSSRLAVSVGLALRGEEL